MPTHHHFLLYKPFGYLSQFIYNQSRRRNKKLLGELHDFPPNTMAIGRLDEDSEGLLLLTTDGKESAHLLSRKVEKEYFVQVDGKITEEAISRLKKGVEIGLKGEKYLTLPCEVSMLQTPPNVAPRVPPIRDDRHGPTSWISVVLKEGKFRQIRKMTAAVGCPTLRLVRVRIGEMSLSNMFPGQVIGVDNFEY